MGGGAPLAFLNKKTWHPGRIQNVEEVWKREQAAAAEQRKLEELRKQYEDERKNAEFTQIAEDAGYKREARLDWMYAGSLAAKHDAQARQDAVAAGTTGVASQQEQPLMGKTPTKDEHLSCAERAAQLPSFLAADTPASQNEAWARLNNDPLLAIKKQEQDALKRVRENPMKMQQILKEVEKVRKHKRETRDKKHKKEKHHKSSRHNSQDERPQAAAGLKRGRSRSRSGSASPSRVRLHFAHCDSRHAGRDKPEAVVAYGHRQYNGQANICPTQHGNSGKEGQGQRDNRRHAPFGSRQHEHDNRHGHGYRSRERSRSRSSNRHDRCNSEQKQHSQHDSQSRARHKDGHGDRDRHIDRPDGRHRDRLEDRHIGRHEGRHDSKDVDHHRAAGHIEHAKQHSSRDSKYGLELASATHWNKLDTDSVTAQAQERAAATRQRLAEATAAKEAAERAAAAAPQRQQRKEYQAGKLSAEEKAARLAEMMGNAKEHEQQRLERLAKAHAAEQADSAGVAGLLSKAAAVKAEDAFKSAAAAEVFGSMASGGVTLDARISSRRHYHERR